MSNYFNAHSNNPQELNAETLRQLLVEGQQIGLTEYGLESLINELDNEEKKSSAQENQYNAQAQRQQQHYCPEPQARADASCYISFSRYSKD